MVKVLAQYSQNIFYTTTIYTKGKYKKHEDCVASKNKKLTQKKDSWKWQRYCWALLHSTLPIGDAIYKNTLKRISPKLTRCGERATDIYRMVKSYIESYVMITVNGELDYVLQRIKRI